MELNALKVKQLRIEKAWTQQQLADICALSLRTIQRVEISGIASLETSKALAGAFNIERASLLQELAPEPATNSTKLSVLLPIFTFMLGLVAGVVLLKIIA
jgi:transcriptional regulator with XRE-family HTH domain